MGKFVPSPGNPTFSPGSLTLAAIHGGVYILEEMPPIPQDELTGLNIFLETGELPLITQFGHEIVTAHPNFRFVATGNFHSNYTTNELNDAFLQRFSQNFPRLSIHAMEGRGSDDGKSGDVEDQRGFRLSS